MTVDTGRCVATNPAGARCLFHATHGNDDHVFADDPRRDSFDLGKLQEAVRGYIAGRSSQDWLAGVLAETEAERR